MRKLLFSLMAVLLLFSAGLSSHSSVWASQRRMRKYKPPPPMAEVIVTVIRNSDGKPLQNAAVVFHPQEANGKDQGNMELKTNEEGKAALNIIPVGSKLLVQVIVPGYRTFGAEYEVPTDKKAITVRMKPPGEQYSIYGSNDGKSPLQNNTPQTQMGHASPSDSPLLAPPATAKH